MFKKVTAIAVSVMCMLALNVNFVSAKTTPTNELDKNTKELAQKYGIPLEKDGKKLKEIKIEKFPQKQMKDNIDNTPNLPKYGDYEIVATSDSEACGTRTLTSVSGGLGGKVKLSRTLSFGGKITGNLKVSVSVVEASLGVEISQSQSWTAEYEHDITPGKRGTIVVYPQFRVITFDQILGGRSAGTASAMVPSGLCYSYYES